MKLSAIIITYFPDLNDLKLNINSIINDVDKLIIWQNTPDLKLDNEITFINETEKVIFLSKGVNIGIASALIEGIKWSLENGYTHLLTLDQDSYFDEGVLKNYKELINRKLIDAGIFGINPNNWGQLLYKQKELFIEVSDAITSGSIFPLEIFITCGLFEDELFIDAVDYEFCFRIKSLNNLSTVVFPSIIMNHKVGEKVKICFGLYTNNYSSFRTYYIIRNHLIIWKRYPRLFPNHYKYVLIKSHIILRIFKVIIAEKNKIKKIKAILIGIIHGLSNKKGFYKF